MILRHFLRRYRFQLIVTAVLSAATAGVTVLLLAQVNDLAAAGIAAGDWSPALAGLGWLAALLGLGVATQALLARLGADLVAQLRVELSLRLIELEYERLAARKSVVFGALIQDIGRIAPLVLVAPHLAYNTLLVVMGSIYLGSVSGILLLVFAAVMGLSFGITLVLERIIRSQFDRLRLSEDAVFEQVRTIGEGKKELSLNAGRARHFADVQLRPAIEGTRQAMAGVQLRLGLNSAWATALQYGAVLAVVVTGHSMLELPQGAVIRFVVGGLFLVGPAGFLVQAALQVASGLASLRHLARLGLDLDAELGSQRLLLAEPVGLLAEWQIIRADGVGYRYAEEGGSGKGCGPIDLEIRRGELVFLVGPNGSGKSTLLLLLCGLLAPQTGRITIDGRSIWDEIASYRSRFAGVFGDAFLFSDVLDSEGNPLPDSEIRELLEGVDLGTQLQVEGGRLSRLGLSAGQRKRVALLQCQAEDRQIWFFDEWAAEQDGAYRDEILS